MENYSESTVRNVVLVSHTGAGKTSLADAMLFGCKQVSRLGRVDEGNSVSDFDPIEINHKISINASVLHCISGNTKINIIDTPGYADFIMELHNAVPAADVAIVVIGAPDGIEVGTQRVWGILDELKLPRAIFISKLDKTNANFYHTVEAVKKEFGDQCTPLFLPIGKETSFKGVANLLTKAKWDELSDEERAGAEKFRKAFIEIVAVADDEIVEKYLDGNELTQDEICRAFKLAFRDNAIIPIFCGDAINGFGVKELIEKIVNYFPAPAAGERVVGVDPETKEPKEVITRSDQPFSGYVFKTISDPYVGQLTVFRVMSGSLASNSDFFNVTTGATERFGQLYILQGKEQLPVDRVVAGDIGAVAKLKDIHTGDSMTVASHKVAFNLSHFVEPSISYSLKPKTRQDEEKISQALTKMATEDQGLRVTHDPQTQELILSGMGNLHLEIAVERLKSRYHVDVAIDTPKVSYKVTIKKTVKAQHKYKKQTGGHGQYGDVWLEISPLPRGSDFQFVDKIVGGTIPKQYISSVEKGLRKKIAEGVIAGYPLVDIQVSLYGGSYHNVDSSDMAFQLAASMALKSGVLDAHPVFLEPVMDVEVVVGPEYMGTINGDLSSRRGRVQGVEPSGKYEIIKAQVPIAEMFRYTSDLRSMTQGRGSFSMSFSHYEEMPSKLAEQIISQSKTEGKEEVH